MLPSRFLGRGGCLKERITFPVAEVRLQKIALDACSSIFQDVHGYSHSQTPEWANRVTEHILAQLITDTKRVGDRFKFVVTSAIIQHSTPTPLTSAREVPPTPANTIPGFSSQGRPWRTHDPARMSRREKRGIRGPGTTDEQVLADEEAIAKEEAARKLAEAAAGEEAPAKAQDATTSVSGGLGRGVVATTKALGRVGRFFGLGGSTEVVPATEAVGRPGRFFGLKGSWDYLGMDGVWDCTWDAGVEKGFDVVIYVIYFRLA